MISPIHDQAMEEKTHHKCCSNARIRSQLSRAEFFPGAYPAALLSAYAFTRLTRGKLESIGESLNEADGEENLPEAKGRHHEEIINGGAAVLEHGEGHELLGQEANNAEHANTSVLELSLAKPAEVEVVGEANGVEANVTSVGSIELGRALEERNSEVILLHPGAP